MTRSSPKNDGRARPSGVSPAIFGRRSRLLLVDDDLEFVRFAEGWAERHFIDLTVAKSRAEALAATELAFIDAALLSTRLGGEPAHELALELRRLPILRELPLAFVSRESREHSRALAAQAGGMIFLVKPLTESRLDEAVSQLLALSAGSRPRVALVDPDAGFRSEAREWLEHAGFEVCERAQAHDLIRLLESAEPDALLVDLGAPSLGGFDVCRIVRTSPGWQDLPLIVLSSSNTEVLRVHAFRAGCDDYLEKPTSEEELVTRVRSRIERRRMLQARLAQDSLTGLSLRRAFVDRARARLSEARRHRQVLSFCLIDLDGFKSINDHYGHLAGDRVLSAVGRLLLSRLRAEDLRARWGGEEFVLAFPRQDRAAALRAVDKLLTELRETEFIGDHGDTFHVTFSAGVATWPVDGGGLEQLLSVADERLYAAKAAGRARIVAA